MIFAQGWCDNKVCVLVITRCQNGMDGWQVYKGIYDPKTGGTYETATWHCLGSSQNLVDLLYYNAFSEMMQWVDGGKTVKNMQDCMLEIHNMLRQITGYVQGAAQAQRLVLVEPMAMIPAPR